MTGPSAPGAITGRVAPGRVDGVGVGATWALSDALEIPQTYGVPDDRIVTILAGGLDLIHNFSGLQEDDPDQARIDVAAYGVGPQDCVVAISASGLAEARWSSILSCSSVT